MAARFAFFAAFCIAVLILYPLAGQEQTQPTTAPAVTFPPVQVSPPQPVPVPQQQGFSVPPPPMAAVPAPLFKIDRTIDPKTPVLELLPTPPKAGVRPTRLLIEDLAHVPEIQFQQFPAKVPEKVTPTHAIAVQMHKIRFLNDKKRDGFLEELLKNRADMRGLPFAMGDDCRTKGERNSYFEAAVQHVRAALVPESDKDKGNSENFWTKFEQLRRIQNSQLMQTDANCEQHITSARIAALMQILAPESPGLRRGLVKHLTGVPTVEATHALAKLALFSAEDEVRLPAIEALRVRREKDYTDDLLQGFQYPLPAVAKRAADALVRLERKDVLPQLVNLLDQADPREPVVQKIEGKETPVVRELVRLNHHQNCMLCHAPAAMDASSQSQVLTAPVSVQGESLAPISQGYGQGKPVDIFVRLDVTYLRQDFSLLQTVEDAAPWPEMQRFDFLVRTRALTGQEAAEFRTQSANRPAGFVTPYQRAALYALRELSGRDAAPTAQAWRELFNLPASK